jgi:hypothetical protein
LTSGFLFLKFFVFSAEALNASGGIDQLLLAGKKWMAVGTDFNANILFG